MRRESPVPKKNWREGNVVPTWLAAAWTAGLREQRGVVDRIAAGRSASVLVREISALYGFATSRSKRGLPRSGAKLGSILSQPGER